jgi:hypothetical protein
MRKLAVLIALVLAAAGGSSALGAGSVDGQARDFGRVAVGDTQTLPETITNMSGGTLTIQSVSAGGPFAVPGGPDQCTGATLNDGDQCSVEVDYTPGSAGADSDTLTVDTGSDTDTFPLSGTGVAHRFVFTNQPANPDFGNVAVGDTSGGKQITVTNNTDYPGNPHVQLGGSDPGQFGESDDCTATVATDCTATVRFQPASTGQQSAQLQVDDDTFTFSGTGVAGTVVQPDAVAFGDQRVGTTSAVQPVTVTNNRSQAITVNVTNGNSVDYNVDTSDCTGQQLGANGQSCSILVAFSPNAQGQQNGTLTVEGQAVQLTGRGTASTADASPGSISFGNQPIFTQSTTENVTVTNNGNVPLNVSAPQLGGTNPGQFTFSDGCQQASPVPVSGQCTIAVRFVPTIQGPLDATLQIDSDAGNGRQTVQLHGTGTPSAVVFGPAPVQFKRPHHAGTFSSKKTITLTNRTNGPLAISGVRLGGINPNSFRITAGNCRTRTLTADASCTETVRFAPNEVGVKSASLVVNDNGPNSPHSVALNARATYPNDDVNVLGAVGCDATKITWRRGGTSHRFARTVIVRSRTHIPSGPNDGTRLPHGRGVLHDHELDHFTAYQYRVFALYRSHTRPGTYNHSRGVSLHLTTGEICTPMDGAAIRTTTPTASWLKHATLFGYSFRLFHGEKQVQVKRSVHALQFAFTGRRRLRHGFRYTLFLYAYPPAHPEGTSIGRTTFRVR